LENAGNANLERFSGLAEVYDAHRPRPPAVILDILTQLAQVQRPQLVVDLGSGTGLSTFIWADRAEAVVGIEPNADMRHVAQVRKADLAKTEPNIGNIRFQDGLSSQTGLPDGCADIVTCAQSLHWMEPESTFAEVVRILRPGGVFAAYDYLYPPTTHWEAEVAEVVFHDQVMAIMKEVGWPPGLRRWSNEEHLKRMQASGHFRYTKRMWVHHVEMGDAERLIGLAQSQSSIGALLKQGFSEAEIGLDGLRAVAKRTLGDQPMVWYFTYVVCLGVK
jgi:ubiquinone/menaquinone biosynthesis C-methylase UbiE